MRSLHLTFETKSKASILQTIWEVWFTVSVMLFLVAIAIWLFNSRDISIDALTLLACHVIMSTLVGITTSED